MGNDYEDDERVWHARLAVSILVFSPVLFLILVLGRPSTYGKLQQQEPCRRLSSPSPSSSSSSWTWTWLGPLVPSRAAWIVFESPCLIWVVVCLYWRTTATTTRKNGLDDEGQPSLPMGNAMLLTWFVLHYVYRSIVYPLKQSSTSRTPLGVAVIAWTYCTINGYLQVRELTHFATFAAACPRFVFGMTLILVGFAVVYTSDQTLLRLRSMSTTKTSGVGQRRQYQIPRGGLFEYVSAPHYLGEIIEWTGFCIACDGRLASLSFAIWTAANLIPRALHTHAWYRQTFSGGRTTKKDDDDMDHNGNDNDEVSQVYPPDRTAILPFLL